MTDMKKVLTCIIIIASFYSCKQDDQTGKFILSGNLANAEDQEVYLEQLFFTDRNPEVIDTASMRNGKFELSGKADEEGMFRLRLEKFPNAFIFINDSKRIPFSADLKNVSLDNPDFGSPANKLLKNFIADLDRRRKDIEIANKASLSQGGPDTTNSKPSATPQELNEAFKSYLVKYVDTVQAPLWPCLPLVIPAIWMLTRLVNPSHRLVPGSQSIKVLLN